MKIEHPILVSCPGYPACGEVGVKIDLRLGDAVELMRGMGAGT